MDASSASGEGGHAPWGVGVSLPSLCPLTGSSQTVRPSRAVRSNQDEPVFIKLVPVESRSATCAMDQVPSALRRVIC